MAGDESNNLDLFRDTMQPAIVQRMLPKPHTRSSIKRGKGRKNEIKPVVRSSDNDDNSASGLSDFIEYLAEEIFLSLPDDLRSLSYAAVQNDSALAEKYSLPLSNTDEISQLLPSSAADSLITYGLLNDETDLDRFLEPILSSYITSAVSIPPEYEPQNSQARPEGCEICDRTQLPLTYHHLIPRGVHEKVIKRAWHAEWELNKVAWLCRACHSTVHRIATNEELARHFYSIDLLLAREDVQKWATWASRIRWKAK